MSIEERLAWIESAIGLLPDSVLERLILLMSGELQARYVMRQRAEEARGADDAPIIVEDDEPSF